MFDLSTVKVRDMKIEDLGSVLALEREVFSSPWPEEIFRKELESQDKSIYLIAEKPPLLIGYTGTSVYGKEGHVTNMVTRLEFRRRGVASLMLIESIARCLEKGLRWLTLEVRDENAGAREFYRRFGFMELGIRKGYYRDTGGHAVIMATGDIDAEEYRLIIAGIEASLGVKGGEK